MSTHPAFRQALEALDRGDTEALRRLLEKHPQLAQAREASAEPPYDGYFHGATLLHHVAGNPIRGDLPGNIAEVAQLLLDAGAPVDATCGGGPAQPESGGGTTLGLVASGAQAHQDGPSRALIDCLLGAGAAMDSDGKGGVMWIALYHVVEHRGQREVAAMLHERGHRLDLCYAAGLGQLAEIELSLGPSGLSPEADHFYRHHRGSGPEATSAERLQDAFHFACLCGQRAAAEHLLVAGAKPDIARPWGPQRPTPLQGSAWAGWPEISRWLLDLGVDPRVRDPTHNSTALGWAFHCKRPKIVRLLLEDDANIDILDALELDRPELFTERLGQGDPDQEIGIAPRGVLLRNAAHRGFRWAVDLLLERGADPSLESPSGQSPADLAKEAGHDELARRLGRPSDKT